jgi:hypothetical protein
LIKADDFEYAKIIFPDSSEVEQQAVNLLVPGSIPGWGAIIEAHTYRPLGMGDSVHSTEERLKCVSIMG